MTFGKSLSQRFAAIGSPSPMTFDIQHGKGPVKYSRVTECKSCWIFSTIYFARSVDGSGGYIWKQ